MAEGVELRTLVSAAVGATAFCTGLAYFRPGAHLPRHMHPVSEAITVIQGVLRVTVEGRAYTLSPNDCVHVPAGLAHCVEHIGAEGEAIAHTAFGSPQPARHLVHKEFEIEDRGNGMPQECDPETIVRFSEAPVYELSSDAFFTDLFARRMGSVGICGGYGRFGPGASLPCHIHDYDESITIVEGLATCLVQGKRYQLSGCSTAYVPTHRPHRFINESDRDMAMIWVYAGDEPDRKIVDPEYCSGALLWPDT